MRMNLVNLDQTTRRYMLLEVENDIKAGQLYFGRRLTQKGKDEYEGLLRAAAEHHDPVWLADQLNSQGRLSSAEISHSKKGTPYIKRTPFGDHETLAFGELNRFYIRGLCARAMDHGISHVVVYRALEVAQERPESASLVGTEVDAKELLADLRENVGRQTKMGIPGGPNSGISVRLP